MKHFEDVKNKAFIVNGDKYAPYNYRWKGCPRINGAPKLTSEPSRTYKSGTYTQRYTENVLIKTKVPKKKRLGKYGGTEDKDIIKKRQRSKTQPIYRTVRAPKECRLPKLINWDFERLGAYQAAITGTYCSGKSNLMNCIIAHHLAQDVSILMFNDRRFEARSLCDKGYFDEDGYFHPYLVDVLVPSGYKFTSKSDPLWKHRKNVSMVPWNDKDDVINNLAPHKLTVVYTECFDQASTLRLWIDLMKTIAREVSPEQTYIYTHHEFSSLIPETPTSDIAKIVKDASNVAMNLRKDKVGLIASFHMLSEVYYRLSQKFSFVIYRKPTIRKTMTKAEDDARGFGMNRFNVVSGGRWRTHKIGMFPEMPDRYRLVPIQEDLNYPNIQSSESSEPVNPDIEIYSDPINIKIIRLRHQGLSQAKIAEQVNLCTSTIAYRLKKIELNREL